jgi:hypothetical protein
MDREKRKSGIYKKKVDEDEDEIVWYALCPYAYCGLHSQTDV